MVRMRMGIEDPFDRQTVLRHVVKDQIRLLGRGRTGFLIEIQHRVDDRATLGQRIGNDILDTSGTTFVKALDVRFCSRGCSHRRLHFINIHLNILYIVDSDK